MIQISINNNRQTLETGATVLTALEVLGRENDIMLAVAVNQTFVPKTQWLDTELKDRDEVDILNPISGG